MGVDFFAEPVPETGGLNAKGARRLLGKTTLTRHAVVAREAVQNIWDARIKSHAEARFELVPADRDSRAALREFLIASPSARGAGPPGDLERSLEDVLASESLRNLIIADFETRGLMGPTRPSEKRPGEPSDFVDFVFNVGAERDRALGAGTYGYGKSSFFMLSRCSCILVDTLTLEGERRLIGIGLTNEWTDGRRRYTGRCWWGRREGNTVQPLVAEEADRWARRLGLPDRGPGRTGTTIMILGVDLLESEGEATEESDRLKQTIREIQRAIVMGFWPKMVPEQDGERPPMTFVLRADGEEYGLPPLDVLEPLNRLAVPLRLARKALRTGECGPGVMPIKRRRTVLGYLALTPAMPLRKPLPGSLLEGASIFQSGLRHAACMRPAELVAVYRELQWDDPTTSVGGVFICTAEPAIEGAFAEAEPPAHDGWIPGNLERESRLIVQLALRKIRESTKKEAPAGGGKPVTAVAKLLGQWIGPAGGRMEPPPAGNGPRGRGVKVSLVKSEVRGSRRICRLEVKMKRVPWRRVRLTADPIYRRDGGILEDERPVVLKWENPGEGCSLDTPVEGRPDIAILSIPDPEETGRAREYRVELVLELGREYRFDPRVSMEEAD